MSRIGHNCFGARKLLQGNSRSMAPSYLDHIGRGMLKKGRGEGVSFFRTEKIRAISGILIYPPLPPPILIYVRILEPVPHNLR